MSTSDASRIYRQTADASGGRVARAPLSAMEDGFTPPSGNFTEVANAAAIYLARCRTYREINDALNLALDQK